MNETNDNRAEQTSFTQSFSRVLKFWRTLHGISQESLALAIDVSPRHISFLETGKAQPSKEMVKKIADEFKLGEFDRKHIMITAGYIPEPTTVDFHSKSMKWLRKAMIMTLRAMDPYPATVTDRAGKIFMVNKGWVGFFQQFIEKKSLDSVTNHFDFLFGLISSGKNARELEETLSVILMSLARVALIHDDPYLNETMNRLSAHPNVPKDWKQRAAKIEPMASYRVQFTISGEPFSFYNISQSVGHKGPSLYISDSGIATNTLFPDNENFDLSELVKQHAEHPLLFY